MNYLFEKCKGGYSGVFLINGYGIVGFRDINGIKPICYGKRKSISDDGFDYCFSSESVALELLQFNLIGKLHQQMVR